MSGYQKRKFGKIRNKLGEECDLIGDADTMIGATAKTHELEILTDNRQHFQKNKRNTDIWRVNRLREKY